ncbi:MAG: 50S ribosomal protein L4 [candidate division Zixibacteria bacterium]|nr:50S ribosomal protein L4 [candidate division Zixibacteria bacterium]
MDIKVYNQDGQEVGSVQLKPEIFGVEPNEAVVHQYIVNYLARQRQGNASTKVRREVSGGGRKPWRQKGTGRARAGTIRSPLWRGGGTVFGPKPREYGYKMPKKMKRLALRSIFSDKARSERIRVLDKLQFEEIKTRAVVNVLAKLNLEGRKCLLLDEGMNENLSISCRNLGRVKYCRAALANGYDMLDADYLVFTRAGLEKVEEVFA